MVKELFAYLAPKASTHTYTHRTSIAKIKKGQIKVGTRQSHKKTRFNLKTTAKNELRPMASDRD